MNETNLVIEFLQGVAVQSPVFLVSLVGCIITVSKWRDLSAGAIWSLLGFGLAAILCVAIPAGQVGMRFLMMQGSSNARVSRESLTAISVVWMLLRALSYGMLLAAVVAGRPRT
jgi:hypothetical protein